MRLSYLDFSREKFDVVGMLLVRNFVSWLEIDTTEAFDQLIKDIVSRSLER